MKKSKHYTTSQLLEFKHNKLMKQYINRIESGEFYKDFCKVVKVEFGDDRLISFDVVFKTPQELTEDT